MSNEAQEALAKAVGRLVAEAEIAQEAAYAMYSPGLHPDNCKTMWRETANSIAALAHEIQGHLWQQEVVPAQTEAVMASIAAYQDAPPASACFCAGRLHSFCRIHAQRLGGVS